MKNVMMDIETLGVTPGSVVTQVALMRFNPFVLGEMDKQNAFCMNIEVGVQIGLGLDINPSTVDFWRKQEARIFLGTLTNARSPSDVISAIRFFFLEKDSKYLWSRGPHFDVPILDFLAAKVDIKLPWGFWNVRDVRTSCSMAGIVAKKAQDAHNALADCEAQIISVQESYAKLSCKPWEQDT